MNVPIVEPYIENSILSGPRTNTNKIKFSDVFDLERFNTISHNEGSPELLPYSTYLSHTPRRAIYVGFENLSIRHSNKTLPPTKLLWKAQGNECYRPSTKDRRSKLEPPVYESGPNLCYIRIIRAYHRPLCSQTLSVDQLRDIVLGGMEFRDLTLVLSYWRAPWKLGNCPDVTLSPPKVSDSPRLLEAVESYKKRVQLVDWQYVAVMLRAEHAYLMIESHIRMKRPTQYTVEKCNEEIANVTRSKMKKLNVTKLFVTADVGLYGSQTWRESLHRKKRAQLPNITQNVKETVEDLSGWSFQQWERGFTDIPGGIEDRGYVAAIQRVLASKAACLIFLGGGLFQKLALNSYLHQTQNPCLQMVCMDHGFEHEYKQRLKQAFGDRS